MHSPFFGWLHHGRHTCPPESPNVSRHEGAFYLQDEYIVRFSGRFSWSLTADQTESESNGLGSAILSAYLDRGRDFVLDINGSFAISILNHKTQTAFLAIDRMGIERMVYSTLNGLAYSNNLKSLLEFTGLQPSICHQALFNYVYSHMIPSPGTIYRGISKIEPGHWVEYSNGKIQTHRYWNPNFDKNTSVPFDVLSDHLHELLEQATQMHACPDTGAFLSGGLDSSSVSGFLSKAQPTKTFSIGFHAKGYDETEYARIASKHFRTQHHEYYVTPEDVLDTVPKIAGAYDEPFGNSSAIPVYYCAKLAKENGYTTLLAGDGGDELFGGNERYVKQKIFERYLALPQWLQSLNRGIFQSSLAQFPGIKKANSFLRQASTPLPDRMENYNFLHQIIPSEVFTSSFLKQVETEIPIHHLRQRFAEPKQADYLDRMLYLDWKRTLADNDIRKVNEMCALAGVQVRYPMLDDDLVAFSCTIPSNQKIKGMKIRHFYKQAMKGFLPDQILNKSKHGFGLPFGVWLKDYKPLQEMAYDSLAALKSRHIFNPDFIDSAQHMHESGHAGYYGELIWIMMSLELWLAAHIDSSQDQST